MDVPEDILDEAEAITAKLSDIWLWDSLKREEATRIIAQALLSERLAQKERDAKFGDAWDNPQALRLAAGEMTAQETRTARAVARGIASAIRSQP